MLNPHIGTLSAGTSFSIVKDFLRIPLYKPGEYLEGVNEIGNRVIFKINKEPARRAKSKKGTYSYKVVYQLEYFDAQEPKETFSSASIVLLNGSFQSFLGVYLLHSSNKGIKRSRVMPVGKASEGLITGAKAKAELFPIFPDNRDLGIPKLRLDLNGEKNIDDIFSALHASQGFLSFAFYRKDVSLGEAVVLENGKPAMKIVYPPIATEDPGPSRDEPSCIPLRYLLNRYKDTGLPIPPNRGRRLIIGKEEGESEMAALFGLCEQAFGKKPKDLEEAIELAYGGLSLDVPKGDNPSTSSPNDFTKQFREVRVLNLRLALRIMGLPNDEIEDSVRRIFH